ncbi:MAG: hypothetical protein IKE43_07375 [Coriobacteriales bacterium]|nr:hypothetical protein [Coriobacteriales bacterium]
MGEFLAYFVVGEPHVVCYDHGYLGPCGILPMALLSPAAGIGFLGNHKPQSAVDTE